MTCVSLLDIQSHLQLKEATQATGTETRTHEFRVRGKKDSQCEQLDTSPEMIEQELGHAVCEQRQADLRRITI